MLIQIILLLPMKTNLFGIVSFLKDKCCLSALAMVTATKVCNQNKIDLNLVVTFAYLLAGITVPWVTDQKVEWILVLCVLYLTMDNSTGVRYCDMGTRIKWQTTGTTGVCYCDKGTIITCGLTMGSTGGYLSCDKAS